MCKIIRMKPPSRVARCVINAIMSLPRMNAKCLCFVPVFISRKVPKQLLSNAGIIFSNPLALPPVSAPPIRVSHSLESPQRCPPLQPTEGGPPTPKLGAHAKENSILPNGPELSPALPSGDVSPVSSPTQVWWSTQIVNSAMACNRCW